MALPCTCLSCRASVGCPSVQHAIRRNASTVFPFPFPFSFTHMLLLLHCLNPDLRPMGVVTLLISPPHAIFVESVPSFCHLRREYHSFGIDETQENKPSVLERWNLMQKPTCTASPVTSMCLLSEPVRLSTSTSTSTSFFSSLHLSMTWRVTPNSRC